MTDGSTIRKHGAAAAEAEQRHREDFLLLMKRGILLSLHKEGLLSMSQLERCLDSLDRHRA